MLAHVWRAFDVHTPEDRVPLNLGAECYISGNHSELMD
jgi:hypothetical protein